MADSFPLEDLWDTDVLTPPEATDSPSPPTGSPKSPLHCDEDINDLIVFRRDEDHPPVKDIFRASKPILALYQKICRWKRYSLDLTRKRKDSLEYLCTFLAHDPLTRWAFGTVSPTVQLKVVQRLPPSDIARFCVPHSSRSKDCKHHEHCVPRRELDQWLKICEDAYSDRETCMNCGIPFIFVHGHHSNKPIFAFLSLGLFGGFPRFGHVIYNSEMGTCSRDCMDKINILLM